MGNILQSAKKKTAAIADTQVGMNFADYPFRMSSQRVLLEQASLEKDGPALFELVRSSSEQVFQYMAYGPFCSLQHFCASYFNVGFLEKYGYNCMWTIRSTAQPEQPIGVLCFLNDVPTHRRIEIGGIWMAPQFAGKGFMKEACCLLMEYAFRELKYRRVEWKTHSENVASRSLAVALGMQLEGILRQHMLLKKPAHIGSDVMIESNRDSPIFSILDSEYGAKYGNAPLLRISLQQLNPAA